MAHKRIRIGARHHACTDPNGSLWRRRLAGDFFNVDTPQKRPDRVGVPQNSASKTHCMMWLPNSEFLMSSAS
jgi:hypothetical protein